MIPLLTRFPRSDDLRLGEDACKRIVGLLVSDLARNKLTPEALGVIERQVRRFSSMIYRVEAVMNDHEKLRGVIAGLYVIEEQLLLMRAYFTARKIWSYICQLDCIRQELIATCFIRLEGGDTNDYEAVIDKVSVIKRNLSPYLQFAHFPGLVLFLNIKKFFEVKKYISLMLKDATERMKDRDCVSIHEFDVKLRMDERGKRDIIEAERVELRRESLESYKVILEQKIPFEVDQMLADLMGVPTGRLGPFNRPVISEKVRKPRSKPIKISFERIILNESMENPMVKKVLNDPEVFRDVENFLGRGVRYEVPKVDEPIPVKKFLGKCVEIRLEGSDCTAYDICNKYRKSLMFVRFSKNKDPFAPSGRCECSMLQRDRFGSCLVGCHSTTGELCGCANKNGGICCRACLCGNEGCKQCDLDIYGLWRKMWKMCLRWRTVVIPKLIESGTLTGWKHFGREDFIGIGKGLTGQCSPKELDLILNSQRSVYACQGIEEPYDVSNGTLIRLVSRICPKNLNENAKEISVIVRWGGGLRTGDTTLFITESSWFFIEKHINISRRVRGIGIIPGGEFDSEYMAATKSSNCMYIIKYASWSNHWPEHRIIDAGSLYLDQEVLKPLDSDLKGRLTRIKDPFDPGGSSVVRGGVTSMSLSVR